MRDLVGLVLEVARQRRQRGDLAGSWDDIVVLLRMARHTGAGAALAPARLALAIEEEALDFARRWAITRGQTPERLRAALAAYRDLPPMIPAAEVARAEAILVERTIELPAGELRDWLLANLSPGQQWDTLWAALWGDLVTTPWERARATRVNRSYAAWAIQAASLEPWQALSPPWQAASPERRVAYDLASTPLISFLEPNLGAYQLGDARNEVARRALVLVLTVRAWQLRHDGKFPDRLEDLVPEELPSLPVDPFSGRGFGYITQAQSARFDPSSPPETRLLYSVGPDRRDDRGAEAQVLPAPPFAPSPGAGGIDIVFPIPPVGQDAVVDKPEG
jgi:hypothetical protein